MLALLRGVNVGGKNKISMAELKAAMLEEGYSGVETYINSGNILFDSARGDLPALQAELEELLLRRFGLDIRLALLTVEQLQAAIAAAPDWWNSGEDTKHNAIFVIAPATAEEVMEQVGAAKPDVEKVAASGPVIFWSAPLKTFSHTRWSKVVGTAAYGSITIRNANTALRLAGVKKS